MKRAILKSQTNNIYILLTTICVLVFASCTSFHSQNVTPIYTEKATAKQKDKKKKSKKVKLGATEQEQSISASGRNLSVPSSGEYTPSEPLRVSSLAELKRYEDLHENERPDDFNSSVNSLVNQRASSGSLPYNNSRRNDFDDIQSSLPSYDDDGKSLPRKYQNLGEAKLEKISKKELDNIGKFVEVENEADLQPALEKKVKSAANLSLPEKTTTANANANANANAITNAAIANAKSYKVKAGDTLWEIGRENSVSVESIVKLNGLKNFTIKPGQVLKMPAK